MGFSVVVVGADEIARKFANTPARRRMREAAMEEELVLIHGAVVPLTPVGVTASLRNSWQSEIQTAGEPIIGILGSPLVHSEVIEEGRRAGATPPPAAAIQTWVERKLGPEVSAYAVAKSIGRKGIKETRMLRRAVDLTRSARRAVQDRMLRRLVEDS
jgi:hypothetical protein